MKTIGVMGGLGPQATMDFEMRLHRVSQRLIPPHFNGGYPPMVVHYCRHPPFILDENHMPRLPVQADPQLIAAAKHLAMVADFLVIPSNGAHLVASQVEEATGRPVVSMVQATIDEVRRRQWKRVGLLALGPPMIYSKPLSELGLVCETIEPGRQSALDAAIFRVMEGRNDSQDAQAARDAVDDLRQRGVDGIIPGCTELPFLLGDMMAAEDVINPAQQLAEVAVRAAMS